jgi:hypothetical protein
MDAGESPKRSDPGVLKILHWLAKRDQREIVPASTAPEILTANKENEND